MSAKPTTRVEIFDQSYAIGGENNADYVRRLAERVDSKMRQVARETHLIDSVRIAVLAAINLADENETLRARCEETEAGAAERAVRTQALHRSLDRLLT